MSKKISEHIDPQILNFPKSEKKAGEKKFTDLYPSQSASLFMKHWPVPDSFTNRIPEPGATGSFWEQRGEGLHCGVDIFAPAGSFVVTIEGGQVIDKGVFTSPDTIPHYNLTYYAIIKTTGKIMYKYAGLADVFLHVGDYTESGREIGTLAEVINRDMISPRTPFHIRELVHMGRISMLHLELYNAPITEVKPYDSGNFLGNSKPQSLINPYEYLFELKKQSGSLMEDN